MEGSDVEILAEDCDFTGLLATNKTDYQKSNSSNNGFHHYSVGRGNNNEQKFQEENVESPFSIDPNPNSGKFYVLWNDGKDLTKNRNSMVRFYVYNSVGKKILSTKFNLERKVKLDLSEFSTGFYFVKIMWDENSIKKKVIIK